MTLTRRSLIRSSALAMPYLALAQKTAKPRMNVLFIASDDLNNSLGCYGHPVVKSPNLDRLAATGMRFDRAYCQFPLCGPSRTSILSGRRPDTTKIWKNEIAVRDTLPNVVTLPQLFRQNGYDSVRFGKMYHMNVPGSVGTNKWDDPESWNTAVSPKGAEQLTAGEGRNVTPSYPSGNAMQWIAFQGDGKDQADEAASEMAVQTISSHQKQPFFLGLGFLRPHVPHVAPARFFDLYPLSQMKPVVNPANDRDDIPKASEVTLTGRGNDMGMNESDKREALRGYYASISYMDSLVGKVLTALDRTGMADRTMVVFWGDHGWHLGEHFRWQKRSLFEESARVPMIVRAPGTKGSGKPSRALVELVDLYPTVAGFCGLTAPTECEGQSFLPLLENPGHPWKEAAFTQVAGPGNIEGRAVKTDRYRYIRWTGPEPDEELYDHQSDPREFTNLAHNRDSTQLLQRLRSILDRGWRGVKVTA
jgi:uncharacterized sulfatase